MSSSGVQVTGSRVMRSETGSSRSADPRSARPWTMSRSVMMPITVAPSSLTTRAPMCWSRSRRAAVTMLVRGGVVATVEPLTLRIEATFMLHLHRSTGWESEHITRPADEAARSAAALLAAVAEEPEQEEEQVEEVEV